VKDKLVAAALSAVCAVGLSACGAGDAGPAGGRAATGVGSAPQASALELWNAYRKRLGQRDYAGVCALFTDSGAASYAEQLNASNCEGAAISQAGEWSDEALRELAAGPKDPHTSDVKESSAHMSSCGIGSLDLVRLDRGWLINEHHGQPGYC
jgi:hypothetical protein